MTSWVLACVALMVTLHLSSVSYSGTLFYLSAAGLGENAAPVSPPEEQETLEFLPGGGSFHIWVQPDSLLTGISLDAQLTGSAVRFTGSTVYNPAVGGDTRWLPDLIRCGTVTDTCGTVTDTKASRIEGGALLPLTGFGTGIGPATSGSDPLYETNGGFLFATVDFAVLNPAETACISLSIGHNLMSDSMGLATDSIFLGVADGPVANSPGATGTVVDLKLVAKSLHPTDFDSDGDVDGIDFLTWQRGFGTTTGAMRSQGDGTNDGRVNSADLALWANQFGTVPVSAVTVTIPETGTVKLAIFGAMVGLIACGRL